MSVGVILLAHEGQLLSQFLNTVVKVIEDRQTVVFTLQGHFHIQMTSKTLCSIREHTRASFYPLLKCSKLLLVHRHTAQLVRTRTEE